MYETETGMVARMRRQAAAALATAALLAPFAARATDGYFSHGYGMKAMGMGGASIASTDDTFGGANNPAQMVWVGNRMDIGMSYFGPDRSATRSGGQYAPMMDGSVGSNSNVFFLPEFGFNHMYRPDLSFGVTVYANGGMNTNYPQGNFTCATPAGHPYAGNALCGTGSLGVDLEQLIVAPTASWRFASNQSIGISPLLAEQRFKADGLGAFSNISSNANALTDMGYNYSFGVGVRIGYLWEVSPMLAVGATYASRMSMTNFHNYSGLFANSGAFDIPANFGAGMQLHPLRDWTLAVDYERIQYANVPAVGNQSSNPALLGSNGGPGFGWQDINVWKLGVEYQARADLVLRAGYNHSQNPVTASNVTFNILAPGVLQDTYTLGATYTINDSNEITLMAAYMPQNAVSGPSMFSSPAFGGDTGAVDTIRLSERMFGIAWGKKF